MKLVLSLATKSRRPDLYTSLFLFKAARQDRSITHRGLEEIEIRCNSGGNALQQSMLYVRHNAMEANARAEQAHAGQCQQPAWLNFTVSMYLILAWLS